MRIERAGWALWTAGAAACAITLAGCSKKTTEVVPEASAPEPVDAAAATAPPPPTTTSTATPTTIACAKGWVQIGSYCSKMCTDESQCPAANTCVAATTKADDGTNKNVRICVGNPATTKPPPQCTAPMRAMADGSCKVACTANTDCAALAGTGCTGNSTTFGDNQPIKFCEETKCAAGQAFDSKVSACASICTIDKNCTAPSTCVALPNGKKVCRKP